MSSKRKSSLIINRKNKKIKAESQPSTSGINSKKRKSNEIDYYSGKKSKLSTSSIIENEEDSMQERVSEDMIFISALNPFQSRWQIKAGVVSKKQIYIWNNDKSLGKLFSMDLTDKSAQIRLIVFNELVDKFYDKIQYDKVYYISDADIRDANKKYSILKNKFEIVFTNDTIIEECF